MNLRWLAIVILLTAAAPAGAQEAPPPQTQKEKNSYALGEYAAKGYINLKLDIDIEWVIKGLRDTFAKNNPQMSDEEMRTTLTALKKEADERQAAEAKILAEKNKKQSETFLAENKTKEGVVTTQSGLQYKILTAGTGPKPAEDSTVEVNYRGTLIDGTEFDSSYKRNKTVVFPVSNVIPGWKEALQLMPVGSKWQLFVPPELAYGSRGTGRGIGPNSVLIFEVELLGIKPPAEAAPKNPPGPPSPGKSPITISPKKAPEAAGPKNQN